MALESIVRGAMVLAMLLAAWTVVLSSAMMPRWDVRSWKTRVVLIAATAAVVGYGAAAVGAGWWWDVLTAVFLAAMPAMAWMVHLAARAGRIPWFVAAALRRSRQITGRRMLTLAEIRVEYAQTVLADAEQDPTLALMLDTVADHVTTSLLSKRPAGAHLTEAEVMAYANGFLDDLSTPGLRMPDMGYRGYSPAMVTLAAMCRLGDRLAGRDVSRR